MRILGIECLPMGSELNSLSDLLFKLIEFLSTLFELIQHLYYGSSRW